MLFQVLERNYPILKNNGPTSPETEDYVPDNYLRQVLIQPVFESYVN